MSICWGPNDEGAFSCHCSGQGVLVDAGHMGQQLLMVMAKLSFGYGTSRASYVGSGGVTFVDMVCHFSRGVGLILA